MRVNIGNEGAQRFRNALRQRRGTNIAASDGKTIEAVEDTMLPLPECRDGSVASQVSIYAITADLLQAHIAHGTAKRFEGTGFGTKSHAHRLFMSDILGSRLGELHDRPPRSKSATSLSPAKSTLA